MSNFDIHADDTLTPPWAGQEDTIGLAETVTGRVTQAFRLLTALHSAAEISVTSHQAGNRLALLSEMTDLLGEQLTVMRQKLIEEQRKSQSLEMILRQLIVPRRAA